MCDENINSCICHWILCHQQRPVLNFKSTFMPLSLLAVVLFCVWDQWDFTGILGYLQLCELNLMKSGEELPSPLQTRAVQSVL